MSKDIFSGVTPQVSFDIDKALKAFKSFELVEPKMVEDSGGNPTADIQNTHPGRPCILVQSNSRISLPNSIGNFVVSDKDLSDITEEDVWKRGNKKVGKGIPFPVYLLWIQHKRYYQGPDGVCFSNNGKTPQNIPTWGYPHFQCYHCPKRFAKGDEIKCKFFAVMTFLSDDLTKIRKITLRSSNLEMYFKKVIPAMKKVSAPYSMSFLMDSVLREDSAGRTWWGINVVDSKKTNDTLIPHLKRAYNIIAVYYDAIKEDNGKVDEDIPF